MASLIVVAFDLGARRFGFVCISEIEKFGKLMERAVDAVVNGVVGQFFMVCVVEQAAATRD